MRNSIKSYFILILVLCLQLVTGQEKDLQDFKPAEITTGTLTNGMRYYIMHNEDPQDRAAFYFAQNVGSILEEDSQRGLAHFLEHMAFNGTKHYKDKQMLEYLEKNGIKFGSEINAFTVYDETVYSIRNVPVQNEKLLDSVLLILHDWSGGLTLSDNEIDNERGVVKEEWRSRYNPRKRVSDSVQNQGLLKGSKYAKRTPIGTMEVIDNFKYDELKNYYKKWYRPDLQALVIVGDIDAKKMEEKVKDLFTSVPLRKNLPERKSFDVPMGEDFTYLTVIDKELGAPVIDYFIKHKVNNTLSEKDEIENSLKDRMVNSIFNQRLYEITNSPSSPVLSVRFGIENIVRPLEVLKINMQPKKDSLLPALQFALTELQRFMLYGATPTEFDHIKSSMVGDLQNSISGNNGRSSVYNAIEIYNAFFKNKQLADYNWEQSYQLAYLKDLKNEDLLEYLKEYYTEKANVVAITGSDLVKYPAKKEVLNVLKSARNSTPNPYKDVDYEKKLMDFALLGGEIVNKKDIEGVDGQTYTLSNGARISLFHQHDKNGTVYFKAFSSGGKSVLDEKLLTNSLFATVLTSASGIANLNKMELSKSNELIPVDVKIEDYEESLTGYTNVNNIEKLFKGIYLAFTAPRFDNNVFEITKQNLESLHATLQGNVQSDLTDSLQLAKSNYSSREVLFDKKLLDNLSMEAVETIYRDRINNAADFDFVFMGDIETEKFIELVKKYIGSIPDNNRIENAVNHNMRPEVGIDKLHLLRKMKTPQSAVKIYFTGDMEYNSKNILIINMIEQLLRKRYMERIREEEGGTYGVRVSAELQHIPEDIFLLNISFNCNPDKTDKLVKIVYKELENLTYKIDKAELLEIKSSLKKEVGEKRGNNTYYFEKIITSLKNNVPLSSEEEILKRIDSITEKEINNLTKQIIANPRIVEGVLNPIID